MIGEIETIIVRNLAGKASCEDIVVLSEWIAEKKENKQAFTRYKKYWDAEVSGTTVRNREAGSEQLLSRIRQSQSHHFIFPQWLKYAGIAAAVATFAWFIFQKVYLTETPQTVNNYSFITGESTSDFQLPDGTNIILNKNSSLTYSDSFGAKSREVTLKGEGFFEVAKDLKKEFTVKLAENRVIVLGTTFNIKNYSEDNILTATLIEGSIRFETAEQSVKIQPDQQIIFNKSNSQLDINVVSTEVFTAWKDQLLRYRSIPFTELLSLLTKQYGVEFELKNSELGTRIVSGTFDSHLSVEQILNMLKKNINFKWKKSNYKYMITK
jgi:ferric-dicitrate binding protein FerR (iron transport regulator)